MQSPHRAGPVFAPPRLSNRAPCRFAAHSVWRGHRIFQRLFRNDLRPELPGLHRKAPAGGRASPVPDRVVPVLCRAFLAPDRAVPVSRLWEIDSRVVLKRAAPRIEPRPLPQLPARPRARPVQSRSKPCGEIRPSSSSSCVLAFLSCGIVLRRNGRSRPLPPAHFAAGHAHLEEDSVGFHPLANLLELRRCHLLRAVRDIQEYALEFVENAGERAVALLKRG